MSNACIFCRIAAGEIPSDRVGESKGAVAFRDLSPQAPTHILIVPREHIASAADLGASHAPLIGEMMTLASDIARREGLTTGWRLVTNVGPDGGQSVAHLHLHLLGGRAMGWPPG